ncbi:hypothetical protein Moror_3062 [Moniliophthora roreri MCA 2997]|uniref:FHA domain-containing protein n=1 Tax=Moniliophthora roreri (strain MCA 2997) TaxID=1381753 RepID=V2YAF5_MONRO|nr:hypothetical protein Moror_3062 [Moniliophthora roreri MCA 2997]
MTGDEIEYIGTKTAGGMLSITSAREVTGLALHVEATTNEPARRMVFHRTTKTIHVGRSPSNTDDSSKRSERDKGNALFKCPVVSRNHAEITFVDNRVHVTDIGSHHGTHIRKFGGLTSTMLETDVATQVFDGDHITFGKTVGKNHESVKPVVVRVEYLYETASSFHFSTPSPQTPETSSSPKSSSGRYGVYSDSSESSSSSQSSDEMDISSNSDHDSEIEEIPRPASSVLSRPLRVASLVDRATGAFKKFLDSSPQEDPEANCDYTNSSLTFPPTPVLPLPSPPEESSQPFVFGSPSSAARFTFKVPSVLNFTRRTPSSPLWNSDTDGVDMGRATSPWSFLGRSDNNSAVEDNLFSAPEPAAGDPGKRDSPQKKLFPFPFKSLSPPSLRFGSRSKSRSPMDLPTPPPPPTSNPSIPELPSSEGDPLQNIHQSHNFLYPDDLGVGYGSGSSFTPSGLPPWRCAEDIPLIPEVEVQEAQNPEVAVLKEAEPPVQQNDGSGQDKDNDKDNDKDTDSVRDGIEALKNEVTQLHALRRKYKARFNTNVQITQQHMNAIRGQVNEAKTSYDTLRDDVSDLQKEVARVDGMQGMISDVAMDVDQVKNDLVQKVTEMKKDMEDVKMQVDTLDKTCSKKMRSVEAELAEGKQLVKELKDLFNDMKQLREENVQEMDVEMTALKQARADAEGELRLVTDMRKEVEVAAREADAAASQMARTPLKRKRNDDNGGEDESPTSSAPVDERTTENIMREPQWKPVLDVVSVGSPSVSSIDSTVVKNGEDMKVPSRKRARKVVSVMGQTAAAVAIGAVAAWTALAFS